MARRRMTPVVVSSVPPNDVGQFGFALGVQDGDEVGAIIHGDLRLVIDAPP